MRRAFVSIVALALVIIFAGCATVPVRSKLDKTVSLTNMRGSNVRDFEIRYRAVWLIWGALPLNVPEIDVVVGSYIGDRTGAQNLKVEPKLNIVDGLVTLLSFGIVTAKTISISGEVYDLGVGSSGETPD